MTKFRGTNGDDALFGTADDDRFFGRRGDDVIHTGDGDDLVYGGGGQDTIFAGGGNNDIYGGGGRDTFAFEDGANGVTTLMDWQDGRDTIDLTGLGISSLDDLQIDTSGGWTTINAGAMIIRLDTGSISSPLSADDFVFADAPPLPDPTPTPDPAPEPTFGFTLYDFEGVPTGPNDFAAAWENAFFYNPDWFSGAVGLGTGNTSIIRGGDIAVQADWNYTTVAEFDLERFETTTATDFTLIGYLDGVEVGRQDFSGVTTGEWTQFNPDDAIFDVVDRVEFVGVANLDNVLFDSAPRVAPTPAPVPANGTLFVVDGAAAFSNPDQATKIGDFAAHFEGFGVTTIETGLGVGSDNAFFSAFLSYTAVKSITADMSVMTNDIFDFESFESKNDNAFTLIGLVDGVEVGRQDFVAPFNHTWTEFHPDDAIFDAVDEVQFVGISQIDDVLILA